MSILMKAFLTAADIAGQTVENIVLFIKMFIPTYFMAVGAATGAATGAVYYQFTLVLAYGVEKIIFSLLIPLIYSYVLLALLNGIWAEERLALLLDFLKKGIGAGLKVAMGAITSLSLFQSMIAPVLDSLKVSAVKKAVGAIPGIGNLAEGVTEMVIGSAVLIKNSIGVLMLLLLLAICLTPLAKLFSDSLYDERECGIGGDCQRQKDYRLHGTGVGGWGVCCFFKAAFYGGRFVYDYHCRLAYTTGKGI